MPTFSSGPVRPGVYINVVDEPIPILLGTNFPLVLLGEGIEIITLTKTKPHQQSTTGNAVITVLSAPEDSDYISATRTYTVVSITDQFNRSYTGTMSFDANSGTVVLTISNLPAGNYVFKIVFTTEKALKDYDFFTYFTLQEVVRAYGPIEIDQNNSIVSTISLAAKIAFNSGASQVSVMQRVVNNSEVPSETISLFIDRALTRLSDLLEVYSIVPLYPITSYDPNVIKTHVESLSATLGRKERIAILGGPQAFDNDVSQYESIATSLNSPRIVIVAPASVEVKLPVANTRPRQEKSIKLDGSYLAASIAGIIANPVFDAGEPISGKEVAGFNFIPREFNDIELQRLLAAGVTVVENSEIIHALSTASADIITAELKVTKIKDFISKTLRTTLQRLFINTRLTPTTLASISAAVTNALQQFVIRNILVGFRDVTVVQNEQDPRQVDVSFRIQPAFDVNYILVTFGVSL